VVKVNCEQKELKLKLKEDMSLYTMFDEEHKLQKGDVLTGLFCNVNGLKLVGITVGNSMSYYYENVVLEKFDIVEE
jgi:hypothetical protein